MKIEKTELTSDQLFEKYVPNARFVFIGFPEKVTENLEKMAEFTGFESWSEKQVGRLTPMLRYTFENDLHFVFNTHYTYGLGMNECADAPYLTTKGLNKDIFILGETYFQGFQFVRKNAHRFTKENTVFMGEPFSEYENQATVLNIPYVALLTDMDGVSSKFKQVPFGAMEYFRNKNINLYDR